MPSSRNPYNLPQVSSNFLSLALFTALFISAQGQNATSGPDFFDLRSPCGIECARSGLIACSLTQPDCLCNSPSWFEAFNPCMFEECPADIAIILEDTIEICGAVNVTSSKDFTEWTSSASEFLEVQATRSTETPSSSEIEPTGTSSSESEGGGPTVTKKEGDVNETDNTDERGDGNSGGEVNVGGGGLPIGAIAGIVIGGAIVFGIVVAVLILMYRRRGWGGNDKEGRNGDGNSTGPAIAAPQQYYPPLNGQFPNPQNQNQNQHQQTSYFPPIVTQSPQIFQDGYGNHIKPMEQVQGQQQWHPNQQYAQQGYNVNPLPLEQQQPHMFAAEVEGDNTTGGAQR